MPTRTFYNLSEEKRARLTDAIRKEFSRLPFDNVSINKIVKEADIPRGSYYQYFTDKDDLVSFVLEDFKNLVSENIYPILDETNGDIFEFILRAFDASVDFGMREENISIFKNIFPYLKIRCSFYNGFNELMHKEAVDLVKSRFSTKALSAKNDEELYETLEILVLISKWAMSEVFTNPAKRPIVKESLTRKIELLKAAS